MKKPKIGDEVRITWIDSGMDESDSPASPKSTLHIGVSYGKVVAIGPSRKLAEDPRLPKKVSPEAITIAMCSGGPDDDRSTLGTIWWPSVIECKIGKF